MEIKKVKLNVGDLVEVIDIGDGTPIRPWTENSVAAIYLGSYKSNRHFGYDSTTNMSILGRGPETWHIVWYSGKKRFIAKDTDIKLLSPHNT